MEYHALRKMTKEGLKVPICNNLSDKVNREKYVMPSLLCKKKVVQRFLLIYKDCKYF